MNSKRLLLALVLIAVAVWGYNFVRISQMTSESEDGVNALSAANSSRMGRVSEFRKPSRDPFEPLIPYAKPQASAPVAKSQTQTKSSASVSAAEELPQVRINGIMWDPVKPMAVLEIAGSSQMVSPGQIVDGIKVESIGKQEITLSKDRKKWVVK